MTNPLRSIISLTALLALGLMAGSTAFGAFTQKASITEVFAHPTVTAASTMSAVIDVSSAAGNEAVTRFNGIAGTLTGTGFSVGGYNSGGGYIRIYERNDGDYGLIFMNYQTAGQYVYEMWDSAGGHVPDQYVNMSSNYASFNYNVLASANVSTGLAIQLRILIRSHSDGKWYVSDMFPAPTSISTTSTPYVAPFRGRTWYAVSDANNTNLNLLASADEMALSIATSASTPNLSQVDGAGIYFDAITPPNNVAVGTNIKFSRLTWMADNPNTRPGVTAACTPGYPKDTNAMKALVLGHSGSPNPLNGTITLTPKISSIPITITNASIVGADASQFAATGLPTGTTILGPGGSTNIVVNVTWTPPGTNNNMDSSASLRLICNANDTPGTAVDVPIIGRKIKNFYIFEPFNCGADTLIARNHTTLPNQAPATMNAPSNGTGFKWGGYSQAIVASGRDNYTINGGNRICWLGAMANDATDGANYHGSYGFCIFDSMGGITPDWKIKLESISLDPDQTDGWQQMRYLIRDNSSPAQWYLSSPVSMIAMPVPGGTQYWNSPVSSLTWLRVDAAAETYMNANAAGPQVGILDPVQLTAAVPDLNNVTGGGIYIEKGNTNSATNTSLTIPDMRFYVAPSNGDSLRVDAFNSVVTTTTSPSYTLAVPNRRVGLMGYTATVTAGEEVALDTLNVNVSPNASGLTKLFVYQNNGNGTPDNGNAITSCTITGSPTSVKVKFPTPPIIIRGIPQTFSLVGVFDDTASSKTYTFTVGSSSWVTNTAEGGTGDIITQNPASVASTITVLKAAFPDLSILTATEDFTEKWTNVPVQVLPGPPPAATAAYTSASLTGADNLWSYTHGTTMGQRTTAQVIKDAAVTALGVDNRARTISVTPWDNAFTVNHVLSFPVYFSQTYVRVLQVDFTAYITSTTLSTLAPKYDPRPMGDNADFSMRVGNYILQFYPLTDWDRSFFSVACGSTTEFAPNNILTYANNTNNGVGHYQINFLMAPIPDTPWSYVKVVSKHVESNTTKSWVTVINGQVPSASNVQLYFSNWANSYFENITVTKYSYLINPVKHWSIFE